jgi:hypothetical protein
MATVAQSAPSSRMGHRPLYALLGGLFFFIIALPAPDLVSGAIRYLIGWVSCAHNQRQGKTV